MSRLMSNIALRVLQSLLAAANLGLSAFGTSVHLERDSKLT